MLNFETAKTTFQSLMGQLTPAAQAEFLKYAGMACSAAGFGGGQPALPATAGHGGCSGNCGGNCAGGACAMPATGMPGIPATVLPGVPGMGRNWPACYTACKTLNPCLVPYLQNQALEIDSWALMELYKNESQIVHHNVVASAAAGSFVAGLPLASNQTIVFAQEIGQQLAYMPGALKVSATFSDGGDHQSALGLTLFSGPRGLTGLTSVAATTGLIQIGRPFTFMDFVCGTACYLAPWPELYNCANQVIPGQRAVYVAVTAGAIPGAATVTDMSIVTIKADTAQFVNCCGKLGRN
jgi:hypothetical protein